MLNGQESHEMARTCFPSARGGLKRSGLGARHQEGRHSCRGASGGFVLTGNQPYEMEPPRYETFVIHLWMGGDNGYKHGEVRHAASRAGVEVPNAGGGRSSSWRRRLKGTSAGP